MSTNGTKRTSRSPFGRQLSTQSGHVGNCLNGKPLRREARWLFDLIFLQRVGAWRLANDKARELGWIV